MVSKNKSYYYYYLVIDLECSSSQKIFKIIKYEIMGSCVHK